MSWEGGDENLAEMLKEQDFRLILGDQATLESVREEADGCLGISMIFLFSLTPGGQAPTPQHTASPC